MKKIFHFIILIICLQVKAQDKPEKQDKPIGLERPNAITITSFGRFDTLKQFKTIVDTKNLVRKTISKEITLPKPLDVAVEMSGQVTVKTWKEDKIKIAAPIWIEGNNELTDEQWLERIGISAMRTVDTISINSKPNAVYYFDGNSNRIQFYNYDRNRNATETVYFGNGSAEGVVNGNREITIYVPLQSKLKIVNKYGMLTLPDNIKDLSLININGEINATDIDNLDLHSSAGRFIAGVIRNGNINMSHGRLYLGELCKAVLNTAFNTIEIDKLGDVQFNSSSDDMDIGESSSISGVKNYGSLQISLSGNLDLEGVNSRIKLRNIAPSAKLIRIFDMNTDLRIPLHEPKEYAVDVKGSFINLYSGYSDKMTADTLTSAEASEIKIKRDTLIAYAKILSSRIVTGTRMTTSTANLTLQPTQIYVDGRQDWLKSKIDGLQTRSDSLLLRANKLDARSSTLASGGGISNNNPIKTTDTYSIEQKVLLLKEAQSLQRPQSIQSSTITIKDNFTTIKNYRYTFKTGYAANPTRFEITCTNCTVDFK